MGEHKEIEKLITAIRKARDETSVAGIDRIMVPHKEVSMILDILEKQIPLKPLESEDDDVFAWSPDDIDYYCAICCQRIWKDQIYCPSCGQAVKWDG